MCGGPSRISALSRSHTSGCSETDSLHARRAGPRSDAVREIVPKTYTYMNNHANAQAVTNALQLKQFLKEPMPADLNPAMFERYPELKALIPVGKKRDVRVPVMAR